MNSGMIYIVDTTYYFIVFTSLTEKPRFVDKTPKQYNVYANNAVPTEESKMEQVYRRLNSDKFSLPKLESFSEGSRILLFFKGEESKRFLLSLI
jgi:hypothetical protein